MLSITLHIMAPNIARSETGRGKKQWLVIPAHRSLSPETSNNQQNGQISRCHKIIIVLRNRLLIASCLTITPCDVRGPFPEILYFIKHH